MKPVIQYGLICGLIVVGFLLAWTFLFPIVPENTYEQQHLQKIDSLCKQLLTRKSTESVEDVYYNLVVEYNALTSFYQKEGNEIEAAKTHKLANDTRRKWYQSMAETDTLREKDYMRWAEEDVQYNEETKQYQEKRRKYKERLQRFLHTRK